MRLVPIETNLTGIKIKGLKYVRVKYSPAYTPLGGRRLVLMGPYSLQRMVQEHRLAFQPLDRLWWAVIPMISHEHAVFRNRIRRRITEAIREVLKEKGYDLDGKALAEGKEDLRGSLEVSIYNRAVVTEPHIQLKHEARLLVDEVETRSRNATYKSSETMIDTIVAKARRRWRKNQHEEQSSESATTADTRGATRMTRPKHTSRVNEDEWTSLAKSSGAAGKRTGWEMLQDVVGQTSRGKDTKTSRKMKLFQGTAGKPQEGPFQPRQAATQTFKTKHNTIPGKDSTHDSLKPKLSARSTPHEPHKDYIPYRDLHQTRRSDK